MNETQYKYRPGSRSKGVPAQVAGEELSRIRAESDILTPAVVVDAARPDDAPLHPVFEWRDEVAAENWRKHEARDLIRCVCVVSETAGEEPAPAFYHVVTEEGDPGYESAAVVVRSESLFATALELLQRQLASARKSIADLRRLADAMDIPTAKPAIAAMATALDQAAAASDGLAAKPRKKAARRQQVVAAAS